MKTWLSKIRLWEIALVVFLGFGCHLVWVTSQAEEQLASQTGMVLTHADATLTKVDGTIGSVAAATNQLTSTLSTLSSAVDSSSSHINAVLAKLLAPCTPVKGHVYAVGEDKPCGTLADVARTLNTIRGFSGTLEYAGRHLDKSLTTYDQQESQLSENTNKALASLSNTTNFAQYLMETHQQLLDNLQRLAGNSADTMGNMKGITADIRVQTHKLASPKTKMQKVESWLPITVKGGIAVTCVLMGPC